MKNEIEVLNGGISKGVHIVVWENYEIGGNNQELKQQIFLPDM